jgi:argininosuccinate lyase
MPDRGSADVLGIGARLKSAPSPELVETAFARELADEAHLFRGMSLADLAHAIVQIEAALVPASEGAELVAELRKLHGEPPDFQRDPALGDLYTNREAYLRKRTRHSGWLGAGRARRESTTTGYRIVLRDRILGFGRALIDACRSLVERAREHRASPMSDYTYLQRAQPTTFGHYLLGFAYPMLRDLDRLRALFDRTNQSPAGCGSVNGSRLPQDRGRLAELLGFDGIISHARDAMWQADGPVETASVLAASMINLSRLAEDLQILSTSEFGIVSFADEHCRASVIMPQKRNPYGLTYVRGIANELIGCMTTAATTGRTPSGQVDNRLFSYGAVIRAAEDATGAARLMAAMLRGLSFHAEKALESTRTGYLEATDLAEVITLEAGVDFRTAHQIVGRFVQIAAAKGETLRKAGLSQLEQSARTVLGRPLDLPATAFEAALDPKAAIAERNQIGGASETAMEKMIEECEGSVARSRDWIEVVSQRLAKAESDLLCLAERISLGQVNARHEADDL